MKIGHGGPLLWGLLLALLLLVGCAAGDQRFDDGPAGFWAGLWHGFIVLVAFVVSLFYDTVSIYEANNAGNLYNLGFVLGAACFFGGGLSARCKRKRAARMDGDAIGVKVEAKVKKGIRKWLEESEKDDSEWKDIAAKIEAKIKRELRNWAEDDD
ncbi:MAG: hypothetical protein ACYTDY_10450 [Planctomycetota bacterium]|jgi:hypothetical protein